LSQFLIASHRPIFTTLGEMTDAEKAVNPQNFGNDPADMQIRIWIILKIFGNYYSGKS